MNKEFFKYPDGTKGWVDGFYDEIFNGLEYDRHGARVEAGDVVIDFGAFIGMFTHFALGKGAKQVYSVESEQSHYDCLVENTKDSPRVKTYKGRVPDDYSLERIMDENNLYYVDFVKMDIECSEYVVLINTDSSILNRVNKWAIEIHLEWSKNTRKWDGHGVDFDGHLSSKLIYIMDKFSRNGYKLALERTHEEHAVVMLYAWR